MNVSGVVGMKGIPISTITPQYTTGFSLKNRRQKWN
jgi:hypothetical protein